MRRKHAQPLPAWSRRRRPYPQVWVCPQVFATLQELTDAACACVYALQPDSDWNAAGGLLAAAAHAVQARSAAKADMQGINQACAPLL